jgi:hypothetical protein
MSTAGLLSKRVCIDSAEREESGKRKKVSMPAYDISVRCNDCGRDHPVLLRLHIDEVIDHKQSIAELFNGRTVPPQVAAIRGHNAFCPITGRKFPLENDSEVFLVPPEHFRRDSI